MKKRESIKKQLEKTDDETLKRLIYTVASVSGMSEEKRNSIISDIPRLRRLISEADEAQIASLVSSFGELNASEVIKQLKTEQ